MIEHDISRRGFLRGAMSVASVAALAEEAMAQTGASGSGVPTRALGKTGERVSVLGLGGAHAGGIKDDAEAIRLMHAAIDEGVTFFDNAWEYNGGRSEELMGKALSMDGKRKQVFLMTKYCEPTYEGAMKNLEDSLTKMKTDHLDLWQIHEMNNDNDPEWVFERGAVKAAHDAKKQGKVRYIGFTGHKDPRIHMDMLTRKYEGKPVDWDAAQMPVNVMDAHFRSFQNNVIPACLKRKIGVIGMKGLGGGRGNLLGKSGLTFEECINWCLNTPVATQIVGFTSVDQLKEGAKLAREFKPMAADVRQKLLARTREEAGDGRYELFKSTKMFDSRHHRVLHGFQPGLVG
ncbi:MAG: aldo/keto reductase [Bryobacteraceae bacterium]|nr:aldo/keto reductase [Bryobacteraceae bacterium]